MKINIISRDNQSGLSNDIRIISSLLIDKGCKVFFCSFDSMLKPPASDVNIFVELFDENWCTGKRNYLIPNQEWFLRKWLTGLNKLTAVLCKSHHAVNIFKEYAPTEYIGFTSIDRGYMPPYQKKKRFIHVRGRSRTKGTIQVLQAWATNNKLSEITIHTLREWDKKEQSKVNRIGKLDNVKYSNSRLSENKINKLLASFFFHVCPSPVEGFGHYINEALSTGAIVITTDAPPMNELVINNVNGFTVPSVQTHDFHLDKCNVVDINKLAAMCSMVQHLDDNKLNEISAAARASYEQRHDFFTKQFTKIILNE